jgi:hypothetical protein
MNGLEVSVIIIGIMGVGLGAFGMWVCIEISNSSASSRKYQEEYKELELKNEIKKDIQAWVLRCNEPVAIRINDIDTRLKEIEKKKEKKT